MEDERIRKFLKKLHKDELIDSLMGLCDPKFQSAFCLSVSYKLMNKADVIFDQITNIQNELEKILVEEKDSAYEKIKEKHTLLDEHERLFSLAEELINMAAVKEE